LDWQSILYKINHVSNDLYAEFKKSSTFSHTWLGLKTQIERPLSRNVAAIGFFYEVFWRFQIWIRAKNSYESYSTVLAGSTPNHEKKSSKKNCVCVKEPKIRIGATRRNLQAHRKILQIPLYQNENFLKKTIISTLKIKISQQFVWELPDGICRLDPKALKNILRHHINQSKRKKNSKKK
jgi:hypothetical protein